MKCKPLQLGEVEISTPIILAPMAGVTDPPFRKLCRECAEEGVKLAGLETSGETGRIAPAGIFVTEMITSRALVERVPKTMHMVKPESGDPVRSVQIYGVDPETVGKAVETLIDLGIADHIDINFGCPAPKVTRKGGGAALPWKKDLFSQIVTAAVQASKRASKRALHPRRQQLGSAAVPITVKTRIGIDDEHQTYLEAGMIAQKAGVAAICIHARTIEQHYSGTARWNYISKLVEHVEIPVIGNGDVFSGEDAIELMTQTGCAGVEVGRGAQGAPWIFTEISALIHGKIVKPAPTIGQVCELILRHANILCEHQGKAHGVREMRKHIVWYLRGYPVGGAIRAQISTVSSLEELNSLLENLDQTAPYGKDTAGARGRAGGKKIPKLPEHWLDSRSMESNQYNDLEGAELSISGG